MKLARQRSMYNMSDVLSSVALRGAPLGGHDRRIPRGTLKYCFALPRGLPTKSGAEEGTER